ncbi:MAG: aminotransferase class V-fold PLP-dependent enzyme [Candidatus Eisenbacteria bacterium]|nr:aminotransferase class V-fold PLP-dependent enzyme [Candidatus Eisenbacteria bacterium]
MTPIQGSQWMRHWSLDRDVVFLNHGSFGACPTPVLDAQARLRARLEAEPVRFFNEEYQPLLDQARLQLSRFIGAGEEGLAFVPNATTGVNTILHSLELEPGDELLTTDHEYNACRNALDVVAERRGAKVVVAPLPFPLRSPNEVSEAILSRVTPRTRLALIDHITSATALILPMETLVEELRRRDVDTLVDGAHAPGMVPLDLDRLGAAYYAGNCHKWLCAPKGAGFLHVRADRRAGIRPLTISHGAKLPLEGRTRFRLEFDWTGTSDPTPILALPAAVEFLGSLLPGGWEALRDHNQRLARRGRDLLCAALELPPPAPDGMLGNMAAVPLPPHPTPEGISAFLADPLQHALMERFHIEVPVIPWPRPPHRLIRISAQIYNSEEQYAFLAGKLPPLL